MSQVDICHMRFKFWLEQNVDEVARTPERAIRLGNYLANKSQGLWKKEPLGYYTNKMIERGDKTHKLFPGLKKGYETADIGKKDYHRKLGVFYGLPNIQSIKVSDLIPTQGMTDWDEEIAKDKLKDESWLDKPINVFLSNGKMYVIDGHHRVVAHRLLGKTQITANVQKQK